MKPMKTITLTLATAAIAFALTAHLHSQTPAGPKPPQVRLEEMKLKNKELLEKQAGALQKLEAIQKEAEQVKFLAKRT
jgi:hypothetical protein